MGDATPHEIAIQSVAEIDRGLDIAIRELRSAKFADARQSIDAVRALVRMLDKTLPKLTDREADDA